MSVHLHIERLVLTGLAPGQPANALRTDVAAALQALLSAETVRGIGAARTRQLPVIAVPPPPAGRPLADHIARCIRDALLQPALAVP